MAIRWLIIIVLTFLLLACIDNEAPQSDESWQILPTSSWTPSPTEVPGPTATPAPFHSLEVRDSTPVPIAFIEGITLATVEQPFTQAGFRFDSFGQGAWGGTWWESGTFTSQPIRVEVYGVDERRIEAVELWFDVRGDPTMIALSVTMLMEAVLEEADFLQGVDWYSANLQRALSGSTVRTSFKSVRARMQYSSRQSQVAIILEV